MTKPPPLSDPESCGEDLVANFRRVCELAPCLCEGCVDYHIRAAAYRAGGEQFSIRADRPQLIDAIQATFSARAKPNSGKMEVLIAGSADTGILATAAHAIAAIGGLNRTRFTVLDLCKTPLALCREFGTLHGLAVEAICVDLLGPEREFQADVIVLHSVLRFVAPEHRPGLIERFANWLQPGGALVLSNRIRSLLQEEATADLTKRRLANAKVLAAVDAGRLACPLDRSKLAALLERSARDDQDRVGEFHSAEALRDWLEGSSLALTRFETTSKTVNPGTPNAYQRQRVMALLEKRLKVANSADKAAEAVARTDNRSGRIAGS